MRASLVILLAIGVAVAKEPRAGEKYCTCYSELNGGGYYYTFYDYVPDMYAYNFDNDCDSVMVRGMWIFYDNVNYNLEAGLVYWAHGIDFALNFPSDYTNMCSSLRYVGQPSCLNCDSWTVYEGTAFTGAEFYGNADSTTLGALDDQGSSIIVTGASAWTFYEGPSYTGYSACVYPNTDHDVGPNGETLDLGIYPDVTSIGFYDNAINSVRRGCYSKNVFKAEPLKAEVKAKNGAWGYIKK